MSVQLRKQAVLILLQLHEQHHLSELLPKNAPPWLRQVCYNTCRFYWVYEKIVARHSRKPPHRTVAMILILALQELDHMQTPDHAVVDESVQVTKALRQTGAAGFVNAVLRQYLRERASSPPIAADPCDAVQPWLLQQWQNAWPQHWQALAMATFCKPPLYLRVNLQKISRAEYLQKLQDLGVVASAHPVVKTAVLLSQAKAVSDITGFNEGWVSVQDPAAQLAVELLPLSPEQRVLDACAAPGGKTGHLLEREPSLQLVANDSSAKRLEKVVENLQRLQQTAQLTQHDWLNASTNFARETFDAILLDAPCSATGILRRQPDLKLHRTKQQVATAAEKQRQIMDCLWPLLKPGGYLLYVTCSMLPMENDETVQHFLAKHLDAKHLTMQIPIGVATSFGWQILSAHDADMDGFYYCLLQKN